MGSRHTATKELIKLGVFDNLTSWEEFEKRSKTLPNTKLVGDYLEILVEGLLYTHPEFHAKEVYQVGSIPHSIIKKYNFPKHKTMGLDGVYVDDLGNAIPYQVKNYSCQALTVEHVATFLAVTERSLKDRVIFTNVPRFAKEVEKRDGLRAVRAGWFQSLTKEDFQNFTAWLFEKPSLVKLHEPKRHQLEFIHRVFKSLSDHDRTQVVLACGTGKTLSALWTVQIMLRNQKLKNKTVMVLVPSLNLIQQTRKEWKKYMMGNMIDMCVCSDSTVAKDKDEITYAAGEMAFPVVTDYTVVKDFLNHKTNKLKVIFSTYHSAPVVARATKCRNTKQIDLAIYDEAHRTAGNGSSFSFTLNDKNIKIAKRLFMTATPKHYKINKKVLKSYGDDMQIVSMDDPEIYGNVSYRLSFKEATDRGLIVPLKVIVSVVDDQMVSDYLSEQCHTNVNGENIDIKWVASQIAHADARKKFGIKKSISYFSRIKHAEENANHPSRGLKNFVGANVQTLVVSSQQNSFEREGVMGDFKKAEYADISNAGCLTEGVDVPTVDMVAFNCVRRSVVDIGQAVGRAMRTAPGKECGYVLIPLHVQQVNGETYEQAADRASQDMLVDIINAVREHDEDLNAIIQDLRIKRGEGRPYNPRILKEKIEIIGPRIKLKTLEKAITTVIVDRLSSSWDEMYGLTKKHGVVNVRFETPEGIKLGRWQDKQRQFFKSNRLSKDRIKKLESINGWCWDQLEQAWNEGFELTKKHGVVNKILETPDGIKLGNWQNTQRAFFKSNRLSKDRIKKLESINGWCWDKQDQAWNEGFELTKKHGVVNWRFETPEGIKLGQWQNNQRTFFKSNRLSKDRIKKLESLVGWSWNPVDEKFEKMFRQAKKYGIRPISYITPNGDHLGGWYDRQRQNYRLGRISPNRIKKLESLVGWSWNPPTNKKSKSKKH